MQVSGAGVVAKSETEKDCGMFWRMARKLHAALDRGDDIFEELDMLASLQVITDVPIIKRGCARLIERHSRQADEQRRRAGA